MYDVFRERFKDASNQIFFFVGNISDEDVKMIAKYLNNLPCGGEQKNEKDRDVSPKMAPGITHGLAVKGTERMSIVVMMGETEGFDATQRNRRMADMLGECVQISTTEIIREKMGDAYSPRGTVSYDLEPTPAVTWSFQIQCDPFGFILSKMHIDPVIDIFFVKISSDMCFFFIKSYNFFILASLMGFGRCKIEDCL